MPKHSAAAQEACWLGVAPTLRAASMMTRMVEAKPTTTAVSVEEMMLNQPERAERKRRVGHGMGTPGSYFATRRMSVVLTFSTLGAAVSSRMMKSCSAGRSRATHLSRKSASPEIA